MTQCPPICYCQHSQPLRWYSFHAHRSNTFQTDLRQRPTMILIGCTGPPALPGIIRTRPACLLEWARRTDCGLLLARLSPRPYWAGCAASPTPGTPQARGMSGTEPGQRAAISVRAAAASGTTLGAPTCGWGWCRRPEYDQPHHRLSPSPPTAPVLPGMVPQCGQDRLYVGGHPVTTRSPALAGVGQCPLANGHGPSDGPPSARRIVGQCRHWRPRGRSA